MIAIQNRSSSFPIERSAAMVGIMGNLPVDGLHDGTGLSPNGHRALQIMLRKRLERGEHTMPTSLPGGKQRFASGGRVVEFAIAMCLTITAMEFMSSCNKIKSCSLRT